MPFLHPLPKLYIRLEPSLKEEVLRMLHDESELKNKILTKTLSPKDAIRVNSMLGKDYFSIGVCDILNKQHAPVDNY